MNDRVCDNCAHDSEGGCSVWECSFEQKEDDTISRRATIVALCGECQGNCIPCEHFPCGEIKAVQALPPAQPELKWIPCSERLPKDDDYKPFSYYEDGAVLFCTKNGNVGFGWYYESTNEWANEDDHTPGEVIAWMPLPEPYKENSDG